MKDNFINRQRFQKQQKIKHEVGDGFGDLAWRCKELLVFCFWKKNHHSCYRSWLILIIKVDIMVLYGNFRENFMHIDAENFNFGIQRLSCGGEKKPPTKHDSEKRKTFPLILKFYHCPNLYHWKCTLGLCKRPMISSDSKENYSTIVCRHSQWGTDSFGNTENFHRTLRDTGYLGVTLGCYNFTCSNKMLMF